MLGAIGGGLDRQDNSNGVNTPKEQPHNLAPQQPQPSISLPKGGGAIKGIGEKFAANPVTGTGSLSVPIAASPGRAGFGPQLNLNYDSGAGNGSFGLGWHLSAPAISRKTDKGLPLYQDTENSDIFILSGAEDLVPVLVNSGGQWLPESFASSPEQPGYQIKRYRPRIEGLFARIERWTEQATGICHWRSLSRDNITTLYGLHEDARIYDPADPTRIFQWLISQSYDDKGNAILYQYKAEDRSNVDTTAPQEQRRLLDKQYAQRYLKRIKYGNQTPNRDSQWLAVDAGQISDWLFEIVLDYGEHDLASPTAAEVQSWPVRLDPFSQFRATFEQRSYRLCRRFLMFHHFPNELGVNDYLVRSTDLTYQETPVASFVTAITQCGYTRQTDGSYLRKAMPSLDLAYSTVNIDETVRRPDPAGMENLPVGVDGAHFQWLDLESEGLSGILVEQGNAWYYKPSLGNGGFGPLAMVARRPAMADLSNGLQHLLDLDGDGLLELVQYQSTLSGFHARDETGDWTAFTPFKSAPNLAWRDANLKFVDLTGDGFPDVMISENSVFSWYPSVGKQGFGTERRTAQAWDEAKGPKLVFADPEQSIFLADFSGDGLSDLARIRNGEICYWPNLGYGRFGGKVTMGNAPQFEDSRSFDPKRIRLADIDGSGNTDIIYLAAAKIRLYFNQSGNAWSQPRLLNHYPRFDNLKSIAVADLLGNGTACLIWSSPLSGDARQPLRYIDLMGGQKPHLLVNVNNNMGAQTSINYTASTKFYLEDKLAGRPWLTRLPFPVHVIDRIESRDLVSNTLLATTFRYRHGYFDGVEREFRGFAYVEQRDTETLIGQFDLPAVVSKTWFHTGAWLKKDILAAYFKDPANQEYFSGDNMAVYLPDTQLPSGLSVAEMREACRALKGSILRQEIYAADGTPKAAIPYRVSERSYSLKLLQPQGSNPYAVFFSHAGETLDYHYERDSQDPRISHALTLEIDDFGNLTKTAAAVYGRRRADADLQPAEQARQAQPLLTYTETAFVNKAAESNWYRIGVPSQVRRYELSGLKPQAAVFTMAELQAGVAGAGEIPYEQSADGSLQKRLLEQARTLYRRDDLSALLALGQLESLALPGESFKLVFTPGLLDAFQAKAGRGSLTALLTGTEGNYRDLDNDGRLWAGSGRVYYEPTVGGVPSAQELDFARSHFFLPQGFQDVFGNVSSVSYDQPYQLLPTASRDALGNEIRAVNDYRVLAPQLVTDVNGNRSAVSFDALGMVVGTALMGKSGGSVEGDSLTGFQADLSVQQIKDFFAAADPRPLAVSYLGAAGSRIVYDLDNVPPCAAAIARETHAGDLAVGADSEVHLSFVYSDGFGREAQTKLQAEPGPLDSAAADTPQLNPRWVSSGLKVYDNKGQPIRQYEAFFSAGHQFGIEKQGVSSTLFYDPIGRVIATLHPNHSYEKTVFDAWRQLSYDVNDTVGFDPQTDPDVDAYFNRLPVADYLPTWYQARIGGGLGSDEKSAAVKTARHTDTPTIAYFDTLGRNFLTVTDNGADSLGLPQKFRTRLELDIDGNQRSVTDALGRVVMQYIYNLSGERIHQTGMEAGARWMLNNAAAKSIRLWDSRGFSSRISYDALLRPVAVYVQGAAATEILTEQTIYGEAQGSAQNLRGRIYQHYDGAGLAANLEYDFKGNLLRSSRQLLSDYKAVPDWAANPAPALEAEIFSAASRFDALNRPIQVVAPHSNQAGTVINIIRPAYNAAKLLERVDVWLGQSAEPATLLDPLTANLHSVTNIDYNAKGQRTLIEYGNGVATEYSYEPATFRLNRLYTTGTALGSPSFLQRLLGKPTATGGSVLQDLSYCYDPVGNIALIRDLAQQAIYFKGQVAQALSEYSYDPLYRLIQADGREHIGQTGKPQETGWNDEWRINLAQPGDGQAMRNYTEQYRYDPAGNLLQLIHQAANGSWTRNYAYQESSQLEPTKTSNRLSATTVGANTETYSYDAHGNIGSMPHLTRMDWDYKNQLSITSRQAVNAIPPPQLVAETTYYVYDAGGQRIRKVTERQNGKRKSERIYLGGFEIYREYKSSGVNIQLQRDTLHLMDDKQRIALVETLVHGNDGSPKQLVRYQYGNHLGSACLELDKLGKVISYEEYHPYGTTAYQAVDKSIKAAAKRYRYTGKERDEETGFAYHGARYYAVWLGRWTACDPEGLKGGINLYAYVEARPTIAADPAGRILWFFVAAVVVIATLTAVSEAGAPTNEEDAKAVKPHISDAEFAAHTAVTGVSMAVGGSAGSAMKGAPVVLQGMVGGATGGAVQGVGDQAIQDAKAGKVSSAKQYATTTVKSAASGAVVGGTLAVGGQVVGKAIGAVKSGVPAGESKLPADPYDVDAWNKYYADNPTAKRSVGAAAADDPTVFGKNASSESPTVKKLPPGPPPEKQITARPKGGPQDTRRNASALSDKGMRVSNAYPRDPLHHVLPQEFRDFFKSKGLNVDDYAVAISEGEHTAIHTMGWNKKWADWINANKGASQAEIWKFARKMMEEFKLNNRPFTKYTKS